jgi:solute carrier family 25, member 33/36
LSIFFLHFNCRFIIQNEGIRALFKGLGPNIIGVAPYRAIYFFSYENSKSATSQFFSPNSSLQYIFSAFVAGFTAVSVTNPIWFVKTRLQLDESRRGSTTYEVVKKILKEKGPLGFYKGISASYFGIAESAMYFTIYENLKRLSAYSSYIADSSKNCQNGSNSSNSCSMLTYFTSAGFSKTIAACICYPHGLLAIYD